MKYKITKVLPKIYCITVKDQFDLSLLFWRYQEFYECANDKFRNKFFSLLEYMKWYSKKFGKGSFTYIDDFVGFNIPSVVLEKVLWNTEKEKFLWDFNVYDDVMNEIHEKVLKMNEDKEFYLIGVTGKNKNAIKHEISHGLFFTNQEYKNTVLEIVKTIPKTEYQKFCKLLKKMNYHKSVYDDEIVAYCSTGLIDDTREIKIPEKTIRKFRNTFKQFMNVGINDQKT